MKKLLLSMLSLFVAVAVSAQVTTSGLNGTITDQAGDPLVGATVIAEHTPSGTQYGTVTDIDGRYNLQGLRPGGPYTLTVSYVGYQSVVFPGLTLALSETLKRDAYLRDNQEIEVVVVRGDAAGSSMNINRAGVVTSISNEQIEMMPSVSRSLNDIMKLTPQASSTTSGLAIGGGNYRQSYVTVDGASFNNMFGIGSNLPAGGSPISLDALEQVSVAVTPFDVRQSGFTGGAINAVTKSGTNEVKVSVYDYYKSDAWKGSRYKDMGRLPEAQDISNTLGVSVGAPILKNKLFVFANFEYEWNKTPGITRLARTDEKQDWGNSSAYNRPTVDQMNAMKQFLGEKFGYDPGRYSDYSLKVPNWKLMARVDWNINQDHALNVRFSTTKNKYSSAPSGSISPLASAVYDRNNAGRLSYCSLYYESARYYQEQNFTSVAAELNSRFLDGNLTNTLRYTYSHQNEPRSFEGDLFPTVDILQDGDLLTTFGVDPFTYGNLREVSSHIVTDEVGYTTGINRFTFGYQFEHDNTKNGYMQGGAGYYVYNSWDDFVNDAAPRAFAITHSNRTDLKQVYPSFDYMQHSIYLQDELSISDRFKATIGLRLEVPVYPSIDGNENKEFTQLFADRGGYKTSDMPKARLNLSPRFGFNWDLTGERKYILRGGTGIFTGRLPFVWIVSAVGNSNCMQAQTIYNPGDPALANLKFHNNVGDILENLYGGTFEQRDDLAAPKLTTIMDKHLVMPSTWKSSLALDMKLPGGVNLNIEGIFNRDINSVAVTKLGIREVQGGIQLPGEPAARKQWESIGLLNADKQEVTPYLIQNTDGVNGYYASVTAQASKTWDFGLSVSAAYTYASSKNVIDGIGDQVSSAYNTNTFNRQGSNTPELGYSSYVSPHRIMLNVGYRLGAPKSSTSFGLYYEAYRLGYIGNYSYSRYSYTMNNITGDGGADVLLYVPTREQLDEMTFAKEEQKEAFWNYINHDEYLSKHIGEYTKRGGAVMPWRHELNFKFAHDFYFNIKGKRNALTVGVDVNNIANLLNRNWGNVEQISSSRLLSYKEGVYTFNQPTWSKKASTVSTWSALLSIRYTFN
ncbi:MAG: carboxypeptidase regulatory-like domain-containing protein [Alistipes sp.]|nr:carboxypeptidase regulatory-like domain-containing protein [Alistipes senegalensis]MCM1250237.1 carboxypeptidase regulatory-like domain-containing protein [Alistipes sp.]